MASQEGRFTYEMRKAEASAAAAVPEPEPEAAETPLVPVADQKAAGVAPGETVTIADQKAGVPAPVPAPPKPRAAG